jgi:hypothetical protein
MAENPKDSRFDINEPDRIDLDEIGHPRGTLAIVLIYAAMFALGWAFLYFVEFLPRGAPHP